MYTTGSLNVSIGFKMIEKGFLKGLVESLSQASGLVIAKANLLLFSSEIQSAKIQRTYLSINLRFPLFPFPSKNPCDCLEGEGSVFNEATS